jgi:cytochrome c oxidase assembly protein subunit 15
VPAELDFKTAPPAPARGSALRRELARIAAPVLWPSAASMRVIALGGVVATAGSIVTGAAVRLSESGLGCPDWPECTRQSLVAQSSKGDSLTHAWVEFGNRLFVTLVMITSVIVLVAAWRYAHGARSQGAPETEGMASPGRAPRPEPGAPPGAALRPGPGARPDAASRPGQGGPPQRAGAPEPGPPVGAARPAWGLIWLAAVQPAGVALQAILGGIVVLTKLDPVTVSIHFLASIVVLGAAVALHARFADPDWPPGVTVRSDLRWLSAAVVAVTGLMLAAGTVVTGTGPLAGAASVPRYHLPLTGVTQFHADIGWLLGGLTVATLIALRAARPPPAAIRRGWLLFGLILSQGIIGYSQYFSGLPAGLVWVHVLGATLIWIAALRLFFLLWPTLLRPVQPAEAGRAEPVAPPASAKG